MICNFTMPSCSATLWVILIMCVAVRTVGAVECVSRRGDKWGGGTHVVGSRLAQGLVGAVASDDGRCSDIGRDIMEEKGGNAVDATVAVTLCMGVVAPGASGIGGGGFLLFLPANASSPIAIDFREVAPGASSEDMYSEDSDLKYKGALSVAVPGEIAGLHLLWQQYGTLPWKTLFEPAIELAECGFEVGLYLAWEINEYSSAILADEGLSEVFAPNGNLLIAGDTCVMTALAATLSSIALDGPDAFYKGPIGENFVNDLKDAGGILTTEDLAAYKVKIRDPTAQDIQGLRIYGMPPPSSGGATITMVLNILAAYPDPFQAVMGPLGLHRMVEATKHAFAYRMNLGDPDFVNMTDILNIMLNATFAAELQKLINDSRTYPPPYYGGGWLQLDDHGTSHFNIVDGDRGVVSMTTTINYPFGAKILSKSTGIVMNNEMGDFSIPSNTSGGTPPAPANFIQPYKRPLSSMSPTIVMKDGQFLGALGGSGGVKIIMTTLQGFLNSFWKGYEPLTSVSNPRLHHQLMPDVLGYENWTTVAGENIEESEMVVEYLESKGHNLTTQKGANLQLIVQNISEPLASDTVRSGRIMRGIVPWTGTLTAVGNVRKGVLTAVSDLRKDGSPSAF